MDTIIYRYAPNGKPKGALAYISAVHEEDLDGSDKLTVLSDREPAKHERLVWQDNAGYWHEHIVDGAVDSSKGKNLRFESTCSNSISELFGVRASGTSSRNTVQGHLNALLAGTRWKAGNCSDFGMIELETWHKSVRECIAELCEIVEGELVTTITVNEGGVTKRTVRIMREYGKKTVQRAFTYSMNMHNIKREIGTEEVYTAVIGYGAKTSETAWLDRIDELQEQYDAETDSDKRKAIQKRINNAREALTSVRNNDYAARLTVQVTKDSKKSKWGVPDANGNMQHNWYIYTDANCTDGEFLRKQCVKILNSTCEPLVRYEFDSSEVNPEMWEDVRLGSRVLCIDPLFDGGAMVQRVSHIRRKLSGTMQCRIAIGKRMNPHLDQYKAAERTSKSTTGNTVRVQSHVPVHSGGDYSGGAFSTDFGNVGGYDFDGGAIDEAGADQPSAIEVVTPPSKTEYAVGERIDYDGIEVRLLDGNGDIWTSEAYPDGVVPFRELEILFDVVETHLENHSTLMRSSVLDGKIQQPFLVLDGIMSIRYGQRSVGGSQVGVYQYDYSGDMLTFATYWKESNLLNSHMLACVFASKSPATVDYVETHWNRTGGNTWEKQIDNGMPTSTNGSLQLTKKTVFGKDVYCYGFYVGWGGYPWSTKVARAAPLTPPYTEDISLAQWIKFNTGIEEIAYAMLYGETEQVFETLTIPIAWNGLETSFEISVYDDFETKEVSKFESSGGGRF